MKFKIEDTTLEYMNKTGVCAMLHIIVDANIFSYPILPRDYQKWILVIIGEKDWSICCKDNRDNIVFRQVPTINSFIDRNVMEVTLVISDREMRAEKQIVFDKLKSIYSQEIETIELSAILEH